ncbi:MAG: arsenate reductase (glutaredoxin) [Flavobacteriaceae bacterium]|nr:arsenate reductase (glutaredoxin) [Flavobacteriaceae bacterium]
MTTIYHNPRCRKSREALQILEEQNESIEIVKYLENPPSVEELESILKLLQKIPSEIVRTNEALWKENFRDKNLSGKKLIEVLSKNPKLIERPIVIKNDRAVIGRPPENIKKIL